MYSKQNYNYGRHGRKRKLKPIPVIITLLIVILILGGIYFLLFNGKNKYEDYKNQGLIQNDDSTIPENLQECIKDTIGVDICLRTINTVKGEISWTQDGLANAKSDLNYASQALNSSKELLNLFN